MAGEKISSYARWLPALIVAMTLVAILVGALALHYVETTLLDASGKRLTLAAVVIADKVDILMGERYNDIQLLSRSVEFQGRDHAAMGRLLFSLLDIHPAYRWAGLTDAKGLVLVATDGTSKSRDLSGDPGFLTVRARQRTVVQDAASDGEGVPVVTFLSPLHDPNGAFIGAVITRVGLPTLEDAFARSLSALQAQWGTGAHIEYQFLDHDGNVFVDSFLRDEGHINLKRQGVLSAQMVGTGQAGFIVEQHARRHVAVVTGYAQTKGTEDLKSLGWGVLVRVDRSDILVPIWTVLLKVGAAGSAIFLPLIGFLFWSIIRLTRMEEALSKSDQRFALAVEGSTDILWDVRWLPGEPRFAPQTPIWWSPRIRKLLGLEVSESFETFDHWASRLHPDDKDPVLGQLVAHIDCRVPYDAEYRLRTNGGDYRWIRGRGQAMWDEQGVLRRMSGSCQDITERKLAEKALRASEAFNVSVLNSLSTQIAVINLQGIVIAVNKRWQQFAEENGAPQLMENSVGLNYLDVCARAPMAAYGEEAAAVQAGIRAVLAGTQDEFHLEYPCHSPDQQRWFLMHVTPLGDPRQGAVVAHENITVRKYMEGQVQAYGEEVVQKNSLLEIALIDARAAMVAKSDFLAMMSHEIRTPMNGVIGMTGFLLDTDLTGEQREFAEIVRSSGDHLLTIINDILDFSKIEAGKMRLEPIDFDLRTAVDEMLELVAERASSKGLTLACLVHANVPAALRGDPGRLRQILLNLVGNAIKFTEQGEVVLSVTLQHHTETEATVRFEVQDTGIGLSPDAQGRLFQSFSQADTSTTRKFGGTGLGLAICKQLTQLMGGQIGVESRPGQGSRFWFTAQFGLQPRAAALAEDMAFQDLDGLQLCIAVDSPLNRRILELYAERWGVRCLIAEDGPQALALLRQAAARGQVCDIAIIDKELPGMNGLELAGAIKADPVLAPTRLVLVTSQGQRGDATVAQAAGYVAYLTMPVGETQLYECLARILTPSVQTTTCVGQSGGQTARPELVTRHSLAERNAQVTPKILVAEDNVGDQKVAVLMLEKLGYRVDLVANGLEALEAQQRIPYAAILMDCQMPEMDGFHATREIRRREASGRGREATDSVSTRLPPLAPSHVPIIAMTANAMQEDRDRCFAAGMDDYLSKPMQPKVLAEVVARWVMAPASISNLTDDRPLRTASGETS